MSVQGEERTLYRHCRDYYAVQLPRIAAKRHLSNQALKEYNFGRLLNGMRTDADLRP